MVGRHAREDSPRWSKSGDWRTTIYSNSLIIVMSLIFFGSWFAQSVTGMTAYNQEQHDHGEPGALLAQLHRQLRVLGVDLPELAVGVPRRGLVRDPRGLPAPGRISGVKARRGLDRGRRERG